MRFSHQQYYHHHFIIGLSIILWQVVVILLQLPNVIESSSSSSRLDDGQFQGEASSARSGNKLCLVPQVMRCVRMAQKANQSDEATLIKLFERARCCQHLSENCEQKSVCKYSKYCPKTIEPCKKTKKKKSQLGQEDSL